MNRQLELVKVPTYVLLGYQDLLFPYQTSVEYIKMHIKSLRDIQVYPKLGHGRNLFTGDALLGGEDQAKLDHPNSFSA